MQVKKFEAATIKDAIELVKHHLGPDAIILSAKDNSKRFGLIGETSVEVTAAVSENQLAKKKLAEKKLNTITKHKYQGSTARVQKDFIENAVPDAARMSKMSQDEESFIERMPLKKKAVTQARYIDIDDADDDQIIEEKAKSFEAQKKLVEQTARAEKSATGRAQNASAPVANPDAQRTIMALKNEIQQLKSILDKFQKVPQNFVSLHPGAEEGLPYEFSFVFKKLIDAGLNHENVVEILKKADVALPNEQKKKKAFVDGWVIKAMLDKIKIAEYPLKSKYHIFLGATGQGKTSTVVKLACELVMKHKKKIVILSGDHIKIGASDQLKIYSQILNVPCGEIFKAQDWNAIKNDLDKFDHVLLDTPGVNLRSTQDLDKLKSVLPPQMTGMNLHYVQSAMARDVDAFEVAQRFRAVGFDDVIFTRLDEAVQHGIIYNFQKEFNVPLHSFGIGSSIPDDYEIATKERVIDLLFGLSKIKKERGSP